MPTLSLRRRKSTTTSSAGPTRRNASFESRLGRSLGFAGGGASSGDMAYTRGQYLMTMTDPATKQPDTSQGYYLTVWRKQDDGEWKAVEDFITPGPPLPVAQGATLIQ